MNNLTSAIAHSREVYRQALDQCDENIQKWKNHEKEYSDLRDSLEQFPKRLTHDVMVPFGKVAMMPGQLVRTNEVLVLLGDNWFALRSAHQAREIVERRLKYVTDMISKYEEERKLYVDRLEATGRVLEENDKGDYFEIREPAPAETEKPKKIRIAHQPTSKKGVSTKAAASISAEAAARPSAKKVSDQEFSSLMDRLDELHFQERLDDRKSADLPTTSKETGAASQLDARTSGSASNGGRKVVWKDEAESVVLETGSLDQASAASEATAIPDGDTKPNKSILKNRDEQTPVGNLPPSPYEERPKVISSVTEEAFCGKILERLPMDPSSITAPAPSRRISKFAQERAGLKKH